MHKLPYDIRLLQQNTEADELVFQLRYNDINEAKQRSLIMLMKNENSTTRKKVRALDPEIIHEALVYINPLIVYNDRMAEGFRFSIYGNKTAKSGKLREWGQMIDVLTRRKPPEAWESKLFLFYVPTPRRGYQMRSTGQWREIDQSLYATRTNDPITMSERSVPQVSDFVNRFNF